MKIFQFETAARQMLTGNVLLILCCACYLLWWLIAFRPSGHLDTINTRWILIPAFALGLTSIFVTLYGIRKADIRQILIPKDWILWGGIGAYVVLLIVTYVFFHRPVTTELLLIVGWAMLALAEINALYGMDVFSRKTAVIFCLITAAAVLGSLVCYVLYYRLGNTAGYIDGIVPLVLAAAVFGVLAAAIAVAENGSAG
ncbi:MAG TPA: hypothetical protein IAA08_02280 [Candidatus Eubacterium avistercoris]|uniref:Uncharacterized protein n=1 Tax=Candidatus Eubacterium avistercoris TaxID=2838567 RepID=A0A9D2IFL1_9FIRM|nr:hypothetical protein [Candidatus Eubacterium avistercoris]